MINELRLIEKNLDEIDHGLIKVLTRYLPGAAEENHKNFGQANPCVG